MASTSTVTKQATKFFETFLKRENRQLTDHTHRYGPLSKLPAHLGARPDPVQVLPNPFLPKYNEATKCWAPAKYSLRRQAELVKKAKVAGLAHLLPPGPKTPLLDPKDPKVGFANPRYATATRKALRYENWQRKSEVHKAETENRQPATRKPVLPTIEAVPSWTAGPLHAVAENSCIAEKQSYYWDGKVDLKQKAGADLGIKLYAGKKRMFKGHRWERLAKAKAKKRAILLRDMDKRIRVYKDYYKKKRPNPLKPPKVSLRPGKLPF